jgi:hypothetical protein
MTSVSASRAPLSLRSATIGRLSIAPPAAHRRVGNRQISRSSSLSRHSNDTPIAAPVDGHSQRRCARGASHPHPICRSTSPPLPPAVDLCSYGRVRPAGGLRGPVARSDPPVVRVDSDGGNVAEKAPWSQPAQSTKTFPPPQLHHKPGHPTHHHLPDLLLEVGSWPTVTTDPSQVS